MSTAAVTASRQSTNELPRQKNEVTVPSRQDIQQNRPAPMPKIGEELKSRESQFKAALPAHIPLERFMRIVMTAIQRNPDLAGADRASLFTSAMQAAQDGLLPDGREGALVIYNSKIKQGDREIWVKMVQWMPMIAGLRKKVRNSGEIVSWNAHVVYENDAFDYELGDEPFIKHKPLLNGERGAVIAAYSIAKLKDGEKSFEVMSKSQIDKVRSVSKSKDGPAWTQWYDEMCRKAVARRHSKVLPMSTDLDDLIRRDDDLYDLKGAREEAMLANGGRPQSLAGRLDVLAQMPDRENAPEVRRETDAGEGGADALAAESSDDRQGDPIGRQESGAEAGQGDTTAAERAKGAAVPQDKADPDKIAFLEKARLKAAQGTKKLRLFLGTISKAEEAMLTDPDRRALEAIAEEADARAD